MWKKSSRKKNVYIYKIHQLSCALARSLLSVPGMSEDGTAAVIFTAKLMHLSRWLEGYFVIIAVFPPCAAATDLPAPPDRVLLRCISRPFLLHSFRRRTHGLLGEKKKKKIPRNAVAGGWTGMRKEEQQRYDDDTRQAAEPKWKPGMRLRHDTSFQFFYRGFLFLPLFIPHFTHIYFNVHVFRATRRKPEG